VLRDCRGSLQPRGRESLGKSSVRQDPGFAGCNCGNVYGIGLPFPVSRNHAALISPTDRLCLGGGGGAIPEN
jgi:hypothetical protein